MTDAAAMAAGGGCRRRRGICGVAATAAAAVGAVVLAATIGRPADAFYLPGIAPNNYQEGYSLTVYANKLTSPKDHVPFDYYSMGYCAPKSGKKPRSTHLSLGQVLIGERHEPTDYELLMRVDEPCKQLCEKELTVDEVNTFVKRVDLDYLTKMNLDNMPIIMRGPTSTGEEVFRLGYPVGFQVNGTNERCLFNHLSFKVMVHKPKFSRAALYSPPGGQEVYRVVGFEVAPESIDGGCASRAAGETPKHACVTEGRSATVNWTYGVSFEESPLEWATRWDPLLNATPGVREIQWFSIINSLMIALFLTAMVALVLLRTVYLDFARYNSMDNEEEVQEESGWKLIHGDVFRPPRAAGLLSVFVGSGMQLIAMMSVTLGFAVLGFLSPANRGGLLTALLTCWVFTSSFCGYHAAKLYTNLGGENKKAVTLGSAFFFSSIAFSVFFSLNLLLWFNGSTGAVPFLTLLLLLLLWFGISVPLNVLGAYAGYKAKALEWPVRTNQIPREIPHSSAVPPMVFAVFCGVLPFGTVFLELVFVLNSLSNNLLLYYFGFTFIVALILAVTCAEVVRLRNGEASCEEFGCWMRVGGGSCVSGLDWTGWVFFVLELEHPLVFAVEACVSLSSCARKVELPKRFLSRISSRWLFVLTTTHVFSFSGVVFGLFAALVLSLTSLFISQSVVITYLTLCKEDYHWWWRSFVASGSSALYVFAYALYFLWSQPKTEAMPFLSSVLYLGYASLASLGFGLITGVIGFYSSFRFVLACFRSVHID